MKWKRLWLKRPSWKRIFLHFGMQWTHQAIECFEISSNCNACSVPADIRSGCRIQYLIPKLLQIFGKPRQEEYYMTEALNYIRNQKVVSPPLLKRHFKKWRKSFKWKQILDFLTAQGMLEKKRVIVKRYRPDGTFYSRWTGYQYTVIEGRL